jgi:hypothetical protein
MKQVIKKSLGARFIGLVEHTFVFIAIAAFFTATPAHAYIDPGSGSVVVTTILGIIAAIGYTFRKYFYKLRRKLFGSSKETDTEDQ